jgi:hypothetical protein
MSDRIFDYFISISSEDEAKLPDGIIPINRSINPMLVPTSLNDTALAADNFELESLDQDNEDKITA